MRLPATSLMIPAMILGFGSGSLADAPVEVRAVRDQSNEVTLRLKKEGLEITVKSPPGLGSCVLVRRGDSWPERIVLQLHLKGLEALKVTSLEEELEASISSTGKNLVSLQFFRQGKRIPLDRQSPYWSSPRMVADGEGIPLRDGYFEFVLPRALLRHNPAEIEIDWIDFYRG